MGLVNGPILSRMARDGVPGGEIQGVRSCDGAPFVE